MALTFSGGVYLPREKNTSGKVTRIFSSPKTVSIPLGNCVPTVKKGDKVDMGQIIASADNFCPVHASVSGTVSGTDEKNIVIENDGEDRVAADIKPYDGSFEELSFDTVAQTVRKAGIPAYKTLEEAKDRVDTLILNCVEDEPYLSATHRLLVEETDAVIGGMKILLKALSLRTCDIAIEDDKSDVIKLIRQAIGSGEYAEIKVLKTKYPQGDERQLVYAITDQEIPIGQTAIDVGCAIFDARTCVDIYNAFVYGMPLVKRSITVDGDSIAEPACVRCPIGTSFGELIEFCGGTNGEVKQLVNGGPMRAETADVDTLVTKDTVALLAFSDKVNPAYNQPSACIRCGRCVSVCPMRLMPNYLATYSSEGKYDLCEKYGVMSCTECGVCSYVCPGYMPITELCREAKAKINLKGGKEQ